MKYDLTIDDTQIFGTAIITSEDGTQTSMLVRGMSTEMWDNLQKTKQAK